MNKLSFLCLAAAVTSLSSCTGSALDRRLDEKLAAQDVGSRRQLDAKADELMKATPGLTESQRGALSSLKASVQEKLRANTQESLKLRAVLVDDVLASGDHSREIAAAKARLRKLSKERLDLIFDAVDRANDTLGRNAMLREAMDLQMMQYQTDF